MLNYVRLKNQWIAKLITRFPTLAKRFIDAYTPWTSKDIPWTPVTIALQDAKVALVTTAGVHHKDQHPFNMRDPNGDPTFRVIDSTKPVTDLMITHDYYDHSDADKDINIVFPLERLKEFEHEGRIGRVAKKHYSFMGHIIGPYIHQLIHTYAKEVAERLKADEANVVILTPG